MGARPGGQPAFPSVTIDLSEETDPTRWKSLPTGDRVSVGGRTVWTGPFQTPVVVAQPNRWGIIESSFPEVPCIVEVDPAVSGLLAMPDEVVGYVDRFHQPTDRPQPTPLGRDLMKRAQRLAKALTQIRGVVVAASPFARTVPLITPMDPESLAEACHGRDIVGIRPLHGMAGAVALTVRPEHRPEHLETVARVLAEVVTP